MTYNIVVGIDGSKHSQAALRWALAEAQAHQGEVTAVFAWQVPFLSFPGAFDKQELEQAAKDFLVDTVSAIAPSPPVPLRPLVAEGDPAEALVVASMDASQLVVGSRGRSPLMGTVLGAVSLRCAAAARCPVTLVKLPGEGHVDPAAADGTAVTPLPGAAANIRCHGPDHERGRRAAHRARERGALGGPAGCRRRRPLLRRPVLLPAIQDPDQAVALGVR